MGFACRVLLLGLLCFFGVANAVADTPFPPHRIAANLYYVGGKEFAIFLVHTSAGEMLINAGDSREVPIVESGMEKLGFHLRDVKILLISHAHWDHCAGAAEIVRRTGAKYMVMDGDVPVVESGGRQDFAYGRNKASWFTPVKVDRVLHDGDTVELGGVRLVAHKTAGHTRGCTTWTMQVQDDVPAKNGPLRSGSLRNVVIVGSVSVLSEYRLVGRPSYPGIAEDYQHSFAVLKALPCDIFLGAHGAFYNMDRKYAELGTTKTNPFVDPAAYRAYVADGESAFQKVLAKQQAHLASAAK